MKQRRFQGEIKDTVILKAEEAKHTGKYPFTVVTDVYPGSGKTLSMLQAADALFKRGEIDTLLVLVPRLNLASQVERNWKDNRSDFEPGALGFINHRENKRLFIRKGESGYITTYQSLLADPEIHHENLKGRRILLVLDEAQQLGVDYVGMQVMSSTSSAEEVQRLVAHLNIIGILVLSGTPFRADGSQLLYAKYEPHEDGRDYLCADVVATYSDGIEGGYLRQFEAILYDGEVDWQAPDEDLATLTLSEQEHSLRKFLLEADGYSNGLVDRFVDHLKQRQQTDKRFCGLIACYNQSQATKVVAYLAHHYPQLRILKAISDDGVEAQQNLKTFQKSQHDVLVTVQMAYVGYDHRWISVVLPLTAIREKGYLRQLMARSLRVAAEVPYAKQPAIWVVPADPRMKEFIEDERRELRIGLKRREQNAETASDTQFFPLSGNGGYVEDSRLTDRSAMGFHADGDASAQEILLFERLIAELGIDLTPTNAKALAVRYEQERQQPHRPIGYSEVTQQEKEKSALEALTNMISEVIHTIPFFCKNCHSDRDSGLAHQAIRSYLKSTVGKAAARLDLDEIEDEIEMVRSWLYDNNVPDGVAAAFWRLS